MKAFGQVSRRDIVVAPSTCRARDLLLLHKLGGYGNTRMINDIYI